GFAPGNYTINVTISDSGGTPIPGATGTGTLTIGAPITVSQSVSPEGMAEGTDLTNGSGAVTNTLTVTSAGILGSVATSGAAASATVIGNLAYVANANGIDIVDISHPGNPVDKGTFGGNLLPAGNATSTHLATIGGANYLLVGTTATSGFGVQPFTLLVYSLA